MASTRQKVPIFVTSIMALAVAQAARADAIAPNTVVIGGATLFKNFFVGGGAPVATNDFIDVNSNGQFGYNNAGNPLVEELAPQLTLSGAGSAGAYATSTTFITQTPYENVVYRSIGSVNGLQELLNTGGGLANPFASTPLAQVAEAWVNGNQVVVNGVTNALYTNHSNTSGMPNFTPVAGTDIAVMDVASKWGLQTPGTAAWNNKPTQAGYGTNAAISVANGTTGTWSNLLVNRTVTGGSAGTVTFQNSGTGNNVLYDTSIASVPINVVVNPGVGLDKIKQTELQTLYVTGRMPNGENLASGTRSVGSGTRNAFANSLGIDPSFASGDNVGSEQTGNVFRRLGANYQPSNTSGTGDLEQAVFNGRLTVGYEGTDTAGVPGLTNAYGSMQVAFNANNASAAYITPSLNTILHNNTTSGYLIGGNETFVTIGDPNATSWAGRTESGYTLTANQTMSNSAAALYVRNITESIKNYSTPVGITSTSNYYMPGQYMAENFLLTSARDFVQNATDGTQWIINTGTISAIQTQDLASATLHSKFDAKLVSDASIGAGVVPFRNGTTSYAYSDTVIGQNNVNGSYRYFDASSTSNTDYRFAAGGTTLNLRNKIAGDFDNNASRNINDIPVMMAAVANPTQWAFNNRDSVNAGTLGTVASAVPEILGDFNGDGTFNAQDVRYFADGLAIATTGPHAGQLDRKAGFTAVDTNASSNFFGTVFKQSNGTVRARAYTFGDSRGDVAGSAAGPSAGAGPTGADGVLDHKDIDYVWKQARGAMGAGTDGSFATLLSRAITDPSVNIRADLSADINGDLKINAADVTELVTTILGTQFGDANLDGKVSGADYTLLADHFGGVGGWALGDFNGDGILTGADYTLLADNFGFSAPAVISGPAAAPAPEPASLAVLLLGGSLFLYRRRRAAAR